MPIEIGLADGTKLTLSNLDVSPDDILDKLDRTMSLPQSSFINVESTDGTFQVNAQQVVYVREVGE